MLLCAHNTLRLCYVQSMCVSLFLLGYIISCESANRVYAVVSYAPYDWLNSWVCVTIGHSDVSKFTEGS